jgi:small Trp-rich protein
VLQYRLVLWKGNTMPLIILIALLAALRFFEVWKFADLSWWWIVGLMAVGFIWFEFIEKLLKARVKQTFDKRK